MFEKDTFPMARRAEEIRYYAKVYTYPDGTQDVVAASKPLFHEKGWEAKQRPGAAQKGRETAQGGPEVADAGQPEERSDDAAKRAENEARSMRRARARVRRLALANDFKWFVTLTLDPAKVDRMEGAAVVRKLNVWCSNQVQRRGLKYILVPERHKKGGIHFHGFFNDALEAVPSGHYDKAGHPIFNLPQWDLGFTTAIELYGDYPQAVAYTCKYIGKQGEKPAGRWYYSGGDLREPTETLVDISAGDLVEAFGRRAWSLEIPGGAIAGVNGLKGGAIERLDNQVGGPGPL